MPQTIKITGSGLTGGHSSSTTYSILVADGTATPNSGITFAQLNAGVDIVLSSTSISQLTVEVENGPCDGTTAIANWGSTPAPATPSPTVAPAAAPTTPSPTAAPSSGLTSIVLEYGSVDCNTVCNNYGSNPSGTYYIDAGNLALASVVYTDEQGSTAPANFYTDGTTCVTVASSGLIENTDTCSGITWSTVTGTDILGDIYSACGDTLDQTYYVTSSIVAGATQLYNSQNIADPVSDSGYIKISTSQYNVVSGKLGSAGSCPTGYSLQLFYYSQETETASGQCASDYTLTGTGYAWLPTSGWSESQLLNKILYDDPSGTTLLTPQVLTQSYRSVSKTSGRTTKDGSMVWYALIDNTGLCGSVGSQTCSTGTPSPTGAPSIVQTPAPGGQAPVDRGQDA